MDWTNPEVVLGLVLGAVVAYGRWRAYQWRRSPLGQAELALVRARERRLGQRAALARWHATQVGVLVLFVLALVVWATWRKAR